VAQVPFAELVGDAALWEELRTGADEFAASTERRLPELIGREGAGSPTKPFIVRRHARDEEGRLTFSPTDPLIRLGASQALLEILDAYRAVPVWLQEVNVWYTVPNPAATERISSQQWHRDGRENHIVKVFTYFSDVDAEAGPFEYVLGSPAGGRYGDVFPWAKQEVYPPEEALMQTIDPGDVVSLTGPPGTVVICDTSGFHRGGFARSKARVMAVHAYLAEKGRKSRKFEVDWSADGASLPEISRAALS
jgi:hypothetical protein